MPNPSPRPAPPKISKEHTDFILRQLVCCNPECKRREANELYEFVSPGKWQCEKCWRKEIADGRPS